MHIHLCHELLAKQERERLSDPNRTRIVTLPDQTTGKHLECESGHKVLLGADGEVWPCDCHSPS